MVAFSPDPQEKDAKRIVKNMYLGVKTPLNIRDSPIFKVRCYFFF
jgi:hypothetical protein